MRKGQLKVCVKYMKDLDDDHGQIFFLLFFFLQWRVVVRDDVDGIISA